VPVVEIAGLRSPEVHEALSTFAPDVIAVACFPWRIPAPVRALPPLGCVNLHPSLLPRWRGPEPLFWTFKAGDAKTGVTVHLMDGGFDTGPILRQTRIEVSRGIHGIALEHTLATIGGQLLVEAISGLADGTLEPVPQDETLSTTALLPSDEDLVIGTDLPASRVADLIRGIVPLWGPLTLKIAETGEEFSVNGVLSVDPDGTLPQILVRTGDVITVRCSPGVATLTFAMARRVGLLTPPMSV
jgi:methionyl-tRNA formyltransferase